MERRVVERAVRVRVLPNAEALARAAVDEFLTSLSGGTPQEPRHVLLSGGTTPELMYRQLVSEPFRARVAWNGIECYFGDERPVPPEHPASNFGLFRRTVIEALGLMAPRTYRIRGEASDLELAARRYEALLRNRFSAPPLANPSFDLVFLGLGADGHTASLFPGVPIPEDPPRLVVAVHVEALQEMRATVTYRVLNAARRVVFLAAGYEKAAALRRTLLPRGPEESTPAARVAPADGEVVWLADRGAASELPRDAGLPIEEAER